MSIKILISYHEKHTLLKNEILTPIQTGCKKASQIYDGMLYDDDGDNISDKNINYNELTAQYWAWKNYVKLGNPDYIGFMHYRRLFIFDEWVGKSNEAWLPNGSVYFIPALSNDFFKHLNKDKILPIINAYDCIVMKRYDVKFLGSKNLRDQFGKLAKQNRNDFDIFVKIAKQIAPEYKKEIQKIEYGSVQYLCNMFIMNKDLFVRYNKLCFTILFELEKYIKLSKTDPISGRTFGYFGEYILSIFIFKLQSEGKKIKELNAVYVLSDKLYKYPRINYLFTVILSKITFGETRKRFKNIKNKFRTIINLL